MHVFIGYIRTRKKIEVPRSLFFSSSLLYSHDCTRKKGFCLWSNLTRYLNDDCRRRFISSSSLEPTRRGLNFSLFAFLVYSHWVGFVWFCGIGVSWSMPANEGLDRRSKQWIPWRLMLYHLRPCSLSKDSCSLPVRSGNHGHSFLNKTVRCCNWWERAKSPFWYKIFGLLRLVLLLLQLNRYQWIPNFFPELQAHNFHKFPYFSCKRRWVG